MRTPARWALASVLTLLLAVLTLATLAGQWVRDVVLDADRYVAAVGPLIDDPDVQRSVTRTISTEVLDSLDLASLVEQALDGLPFDVSLLPLDEFVASIVDEAERLVRDTVADVVASEGFAAAWESANRSGYEQIVDGITGAGGAGGSPTEVSVDADVFVEAFREGLVASGREGLAALVPDVDASFVVFSSDSLPLARATTRALASTGAWTVVLALLAVIGVVLAAPRRLVGLGLAAGGVAAGSLALLTVLSSARRAYVSAYGTLLPASARESLFDQLTSGLRTSSLVVLAVAAAVLAISVALGLRRLPKGADESP